MATPNPQDVPLPSGLSVSASSASSAFSAPPRDEVLSQNTYISGLDTLPQPDSASPICRSPRDDSPGQARSRASTTTPIIRAHSSNSSSFLPAGRIHGPGHLPSISPPAASFSPSPVLSPAPSPAPAPAAAPVTPSVHAVSGAATSALPAAPLSAQSQSQGAPLATNPPTGLAPNATSSAVIAPSGLALPAKIPGRENPPGRPGGSAPVPLPLPPPQGAHPTLPSSSSSSQYYDASLPLRRSARYPNIELQPRTRPISLPQLVNEVKGIYVGLAMVESKCIEIDNEQSANRDPSNELDDDQWQALIALHRTLLHEHHDFMLASQHPSASPALRRVAQKYAMPARMWRHGIHSFLELLRHRLPESREHMITFIYMAYSIIALLYESVHAFESTWVECLGDLSRYRMAIEDDNQRVRDTWTGVSRRWYTLASDRAPTTGRLHHHLAILARPYIVTQLFYYVKSLCVPIPFSSTRESIKTLLDPIRKGTHQRLPAVEVAFVKAHADLFMDVAAQSQFASTLASLIDDLDEHIDKAKREWIETGAHMGIVNSCSLLGYGREENALARAIRTHALRTAGQAGDAQMTDALDLAERKVDPRVVEALRPAQTLVTKMDRVIFSRTGDRRCDGYIHARLAWMLCMAGLPAGIAYLEHEFPWDELVESLNHMLLSYTSYTKIEQQRFMQPRVDQKLEEERRLQELQLKQQQQQQQQQQLFFHRRQQQQQQEEEDAMLASAGDNDNRCAPPPVEPTNVVVPVSSPPRNNDDKPLPEDWSLRGLVWADNYFPQGWFANMDSVDDDEKLMETASTTPARRDRILWIACRLATYQRWILYDRKEHRFSVAAAFSSRRGRGKGKEAACDDDSDNSDDDAKIKTEDADDAAMQYSEDDDDDDDDDDNAGAEMGEDGEEMDEEPELEADDDSDTADFDEDDEDDDVNGAGGGADDVSLSGMDALARAKIEKFNKEHNKPRNKPRNDTAAKPGPS